MFSIKSFYYLLYAFVVIFEARKHFIAFLRITTCDSQVAGNRRWGIANSVCENFFVWFVLCFPCIKYYKVKIIMPEDMSEERKKIIINMGAELLFVKAGAFQQAIELRDEICKTIPNHYNFNQFSIIT